ncbi:MAG: hypothetical protein ACW99H_00750 [Candidatus Thorarchaeota archaeon]
MTNTKKRRGEENKKTNRLASGGGRTNTASLDWFNTLLRLKNDQVTAATKYRAESNNSW